MIMKTEKVYTIIKKVTAIISVVFVTVFFNACEVEVKEWETELNQLVITEYVINNSEEFSEFEGVLEITGVGNILRVRGPFTLMLPTNDAMQAYYKSKGVSGYEQIDVEELETFALNHIFKGEISTGAIGQGTLPFVNGIGDFVASDLPGIEIELNKVAIITKRDILVSNGYIHHIDHVLEPIIDDVFTTLQNDGGYSIFTNGLQKTGLQDTLTIIDFPYGTTTARNRYTILAVPDSLYSREGINSVDDLIAKYSDSDDLTNPENGFFRYMEYHCLTGTHYFSDFVPGDKGDIYYLISYNNFLNIKVAKEYRINDDGETYTGFYDEQSNIPAKNGTIHTINSQLPEVESEPVEVIVQTTDFFDLQQGSYYLDHYQRFYDGENTFEYIKWDAESMLYYLKPDHNLMDDDALNLDGHFWIQITTPKIRAGKYELAWQGFQGGGRAVMACYIDGEYFAEVNPNLGAWGDPPLAFGIMEFEKTEQHTIKLQSTIPGGIFWDFVQFTPVP